jgi:hypothetical protein
VGENKNKTKYRKREERKYENFENEIRYGKRGKVSKGRGYGKFSSVER